MNIFDQYGIKEVADVCLYSIHKKNDESGDIYYVPALFLDTLKITSTEKTAETTWAQGGKGNTKLIPWDHSKTINLKLEDALCTPASLGLCWGGILGSGWKDGEIRNDYGIKNLTDVSHISNIEKCFFPNKDLNYSTVNSLLPRDRQEDVMYDIDGSPVFVDRSSIIDGTLVKGFSYVDSRPYQWTLEIESEMKSVVVVPDRFFSIYGKFYPIKRKQTIGINTPSDSIKYEIIFMRGYDKYENEGEAKIIYHKLQYDPTNPPYEYVCEDDREGLMYLDNMEEYPYLKIRYCQDGTIKAFLGDKKVGWDYTREIVPIETSDGTSYQAPPNGCWIEMPQIDTTQFKQHDYWITFNSMNALCYYLITTYESNIISISSKKIVGGLSEKEKYLSAKITYLQQEDGQYVANFFATLNPGATYEIIDVEEGQEPDFSNKREIVAESETLMDLKVVLPNLNNQIISCVKDKNDACKRLIGLGLSQDLNYTDKIRYVFFDKTKESDILILESQATVNLELFESYSIKSVVGLDYELDNENTDYYNPSSCQKRKAAFNSLWAYINPRTMTPYDDDYWFHPNEDYLKASITLSTKEQKLDSKSITIKAGEFPGSYKITAQTFIRDRQGKDEKIQLIFPLCKIKSEQNLTMQADGEPTVFNLDAEIATPQNGAMMEMLFYNSMKEYEVDQDGNMHEKDGSDVIKIN